MPITALLDRPEGLKPFDVSLVRDGYYRDFGPLKARMPPAPIVPSLGRPAIGGDALELADLALARGDAFDASAQYRALLPEAHASASVYVTLQLARAYRELGDRERALPLLVATANGTGSPAWVALTELAEIRAHEIGGVAAARELAPRAGRRAEHLVDHLIHTLPDDEAAALLLDKAVRLNECEFAAQAYLLDPGLAEADDAPCTLSANEVRYRAVVVERVERLVEYYDHLAPFVTRWEQLADAVRGGDRAAEPWVSFAEELSSLETYARPSGQMYWLSEITASALIISAELSLARFPPDERFLARIHAVSDRIELHDGNRVRRHVEALRRAYGPAMQP